MCVHVRILRYVCVDIHSKDKELPFVYLCLCMYVRSVTKLSYTFDSGYRVQWVIKFAVLTIRQKCVDRIGCQISGTFSMVPPLNERYHDT